MSHLVESLDEAWYENFEAAITACTIKKRQSLS